MTVPFENDDDDNYEVITPFEGMEPDQMTVTVGGTTYIFGGYVGKGRRSHILPDTLLFERCDVVKE